MNILKENDNYIAFDCRDTILSGNYQLLEKTYNHPTGETIGIYSNKKDLMITFNLISKGQGK